MRSFLVSYISHLDLSPNKYDLTVLSHRLNVFQKSSPKVLGKLDTLNY